MAEVTNTLAITSDRLAELTPAFLAVQDDNLVPLTVTLDAATFALFGAGPQLWLDFERADGTSCYVGPYSVTATEDVPDDIELTIPASVLSVRGTLRVQARITDDDGLEWHSYQAYTTLPAAIESDTPATTDDRQYVEVPAAYVAGNLLTYDPVSGRLVDTGISAADLQALLAG